jgi:uncharacterized membrane protein
MISKLAQYLFAVGLAAAGGWALLAYAPLAEAWLTRQGYEVGQPVFLWVLALIPVLVIVRAHTLSDLPLLQQVLSVLLRTAIVLLVTASLLDVQKVDEEPAKTAVVYVVDVSDSVPDAALEKARERIQASIAARGSHLVRLVVFGREPREVPLPFSAGQPLAPIPRLDGEGGQGTNVQGALRLAFGLFPEDRLKRVVLVTDGLETDGTLAAEVGTAARFGVPLHYLDFTDVPRPTELMVTGVSVPDTLKQNIPFEVSATLKATQPVQARCELAVDGVVHHVIERSFDSGDTKLIFEPTRVPKGGEMKVSVACTPDRATEDRFASNNRYELPIKVPERPKILYVEGDVRERKRLVAALQEDFDVELRGPEGVPRSAKDAAGFDLVFISDVPREGAMGTELMSTSQMKVLEHYARAGGGVIVAGGENSFGPGGYTGTHLEREVLPVKLDVQKKEDMPALALMLVIDRSGSMAGEKIELAKEAARATLEVLQPSDKLGIVAFDSNPVLLVKLQRAANRLKITDSIRKLTTGGGTEIFPGLDVGYRDLRDTRARVKHIILLTDGQSPKRGILELVAQGVQDKITISTVAVGAGADRQLLSQMAEEGRGNAYRTQSAKNIPKIFLKETTEVSRRAMIEDPFRPQMVKRFKTLQMFSGVGMEHAPVLTGYTSTQAKPRAEVLLTTHLGEPLLARWTLGMGKVVVWTSDVKNRWAANWLSWPGYAKFWRQAIRDTLRVEKEDPRFEMVADIDRGVLTVGVDAVDQDDGFIDGLSSQVSVTDPGGGEHQVELVQVAAGRYEGKLPLAQYGAYTIHGTHTPKANPEALFQSHGMVTWPFPTEHLVGAPDLGPVRELAAATGGQLAPADATLFDTEGKTTEKRLPQWPLPLYLALGLLLLDVLLRRVRFYGRTRLSWDEVRG